MQWRVDVVIECFPDRKSSFHHKLLRLRDTTDVVVLGFYADVIPSEIRDMLNNRQIGKQLMPT